MKQQVLKTALCLIVAVGFSCYPRSAWVQAQYAISTRAGMVSRIRGQVFIQHAQGGDRQPAEPDIQMMDGDRLATDFMSRAEILISSAAFLNLDEWSEARAVDTRLTEARFELLRGTFMIKAGNPVLRSLGPYVRGARVGKMNEIVAFELATPQGILTVAKTGLYRITIEPSATLVDVFEGEIELGGRREAIGHNVQKVNGGKKAKLAGRNPLIPVITLLNLKYYDEFDRWCFPIADHGMAVRAVGEAFATGDGEKERYRVVPDFRVRDGQTLSTETSGYLELRISLEAYLCLNRLTRLRAIGSTAGEAVFELLEGSIIVSSAETVPMRPISIMTPRGIFAVKRGAVARFEVTPAETSVEVRRGQVRTAATAISQGRRLLLGGGTSHLEAKVANKKDAPDGFDRWSTGLLRAGTITRHEGRVTLERQGEAGLDLVNTSPGNFVHMLEGAHLSTGRGGRAVLIAGPIMINVNKWQSMIHVNESAEIVAVSSSDPEREFEILRGSAIVYVEPPTALFSKTKLRISTPHGLAQISGSGAFRFDVDPLGTSIRVRSGSLLVTARGERSAKAAVKVKEKQTARLGPEAGPPQISYILDTPDEFDQWSIGAREFPFESFRRR
ncbi:MAG: FecR domain-containing protein [Acidobacteriota bacterium]|jgi:ferric-dicitrate binding protein FerR (iron transport regulator)